jgi:hypothetical protein
VYSLNKTFSDYLGLGTLKARKIDKNASVYCTKLN